MNTTSRVSTHPGRRNLKLLHLDIETTPALCWTWALHKQDIGVDQIVRPTSLLCFSAKWHGDKDIMFHRSVKQSGRDFDAMVRAAHKLLSEADAICHYNGVTFDIPRLNQEFLRLGLPPPPPTHQIDLKVVVMSKFSMVSSKLAFVGPYLKIGEKVKHEGWPLWIACLDGDEDAWQRMETYNRQDVALLEKLYSKVLPWIDRHPNRNLYTDLKEGEKVCPNCGSEKVQARGEHCNSTLIYKRFQCNECGRWFRARFASRTDAKAAVR
jgi:predicted RNA-binding Zn-ribbon protein involved in translation (DUF1610 family)